MDLGLPSKGSPEEYIQSVIAKLYDSIPPQVTRIVVQGDTSSAYAGAVFAAEREIPLHHIEAGVRSFDLNDPAPEEGFRVGITQLATWHYAVSEVHAHHCRVEGAQADKVLVTGNTIVDMMPRLRSYPAVHGLVTLHRRESFGEALTAIVLQVYAACRWMAGMVYWPLHPNPEVARAIAMAGERPPPNLIFLPPQDREQFLALLGRALFVLTDSGGVQEEAALWGVPAIIARKKTDRPETVKSGHAYLMGENGPAMIPHFIKLAHRQPPLPRYDGYDGPTGQPAAVIAEHLVGLEGVGVLSQLNEPFAGSALVSTERLMPGAPVEANVVHQEQPRLPLGTPEDQTGAV